MGIKTAIQWTDGGASWNPWHGCLKVSPGCKFCYMYREKIRYGQQPDVIVRSKTKFEDPLRWARSGKAPKFCFTCSWSDFFIAQADGWRDAAWEIIRKTPQITYQILTKRPERIKDHLPLDWGEEGYPNVWLGISAENQEYADERIPILQMTPARIRFVSLEPLLGRIDFNYHGPELTTNYLTGFAGGDPKIPGIDWGIAGGESGTPDEPVRPTQPDHVRFVRDQFVAAGKPFWFKQWGEYGEGGLRIGTKASGNTLDGKVWEQMPEIAIESHS